MFCLGGWQMLRAAEKIEMQGAADEAAAASPVSLSQFLENPAAPDTVPSYARVLVEGQPLPSLQMLRDNRVLKGVPGFDVILPIRLMLPADQTNATGSVLVLMNRGWLPLGQSRDQLPAVGFRTSAAVELTGTVTRPSIGFSSGPALAQSGNWPRLLQHFNYVEIEQALGEPVLPLLVEVVGGPDRTAVEASGIPLLAPNWQPVAFGPERHYGYAFQWWAMLFVLTGLFVFLNTRKIPVSNP